MQALLGLIFLFVLLTTDASLQCVVCQAVSRSCTGHKVTCPPDEDTCMSMLTETKQGGLSVSAILKSCSTKPACTAAQADALKRNVPGGINMTIECSKAPSSPGSLLLTLSALVLLNLLL